MLRGAERRHQTVKKEDSPENYLSNVPQFSTPNNRFTKKLATGDAFNGEHAMRPDRRCPKILTVSEPFEPAMWAIATVLIAAMISFALT